MKPTIMKHTYLTLCACFLLLATTIKAQQYSFETDRSTLLLRDVNITEVTGYGGKEIVLVNMDLQNLDEEDIDRTRGLQKLNPYGLSDNSGIGLSILEENGKILITQTNNSMLEGEYTLKMPKGLALYVENTSAHAEDLFVENLNGELIISTNYSDIELKKVTGPMSIKTVYGDIDIRFEKVNTSAPSELHSVYGFVDVSVPEASSLDLNLETIYGEIFSDLNISIDVIQEVNNSRKNACYEVGNEINGTLNGGGTDLSIKANHDNIYIRKL